MSRLTEYQSLATTLREGWDPSPLNPPLTRTEDEITDVELHHTGDNGPASLSFDDKTRWLLSIKDYHVNTKGWTDIFYHAFVFADGEIWLGRNVLRSSQSDIPDTITVHIPGNNPQPTEVQYQSILALCRLWATAPENIRDHQGRPASTYCAGPNVRAILPRLRGDFVMPQQHTHTYQDLSSHPEAVEAEQLGFWNGTDPTGAASRSVVAVMTDRAYQAAKEHTDKQVAALLDEMSRLADLVNSLETRLGTVQARVAELETMSPPTMNAIVAEIQRRLAS